MPHLSAHEFTGLGGLAVFVEVGLLYWLGAHWWSIQFVATIVTVGIGLAIYQYFVKPKTWDR